MPAGDHALNTAAGTRFEFATATRIIFGNGTCGELPAIAAGCGGRVLVVTGASPARHGALLDKLRGAVEHVELVPISHEPTVADAEAGVRVARAARVNVVVAIGGGSAIDAGKAIAALAANPGQALDYLEVVGRGQALPHPSLPFIAIPTTAGTGAEVTRNAVLAVPEARVKVSLRSAHMLPRVAVVDPELAHGLPATITATTGMDALTQLIEPFISARANPMTDALCRDGMARVARALPIACADSGDAAARADLALGALYSGIALANAGLGAVHGFAAPIGGLFPAPHGAICAALLPFVLEANLAALQARAPGHSALARLDEVAVLLTGRPEARARDAVSFCRELARQLGIPPLSAWGIASENIAGLVEKAGGASSMKANPIVLTERELSAILTAALPPPPPS